MEMILIASIILVFAIFAAKYLDRRGRESINTMEQGLGQP